MAITNATILSNLNGVYKRVYGQLIKAIPKGGWLTKNIPFDRGNMVGDSFHEVVELTQEQGYTYGGSTSGDLFTVNDPVSMQTAPASVTPFDSIMQCAISYRAAQRAMRAGPRAFVQSVGLVVKNAMESTLSRLETSYLYGSSTEGIGQLAINTFTRTSSGVATMVFAENQWAPGIWFGKEGALLELYDEGDALETEGGSGEVTVSKVNFSTRTVTVTSSNDTLITQIDTKSASETLDVYFAGSHDNDMVGLDVIFQNTTGTIHGISADTYGMWAGNSFDAGSGQLTFTMLQGFCAQLNARGLEEDIKCLVNPFTWSDLHQEQEATRVRDSSYNSSKYETGAKEIVYHTQSGRLTIVSHPMVKGGEAFIFPDGAIKRIGSSEREWDIPGQKDNPWSPIEGKSGAYMRIYNDITIFVRKPAKCAKVHSIVNTTGTTGLI